MIPTEPTGTTTTMRPLAGRTALVTGSDRNIGRAIAVALAAQRANQSSTGTGIATPSTP